MQILTNNVLMYNADNNRQFTSLDMRSEYSHYSLLNAMQINEQVSVVFDNRHNGLSQSLAKKIHNTAYLTNNTV